MSVALADLRNSKVAVGALRGCIVLIRRELPHDLDVIDEIHRQAFAAQAPVGQEPVEVGLVRALRADTGWVPALSLVAESTDGEVIGHAVGTEGSIADTPAIGLGPVAVLPAHQGRQVGHALMHAVLAAADALGYPAVVLLGHTDYYQRFGFVPAVSVGIVPPEPDWGDHFQARLLTAQGGDPRGPFRYAAPFDDL